MKRKRLTILIVIMLFFGMYISANNIQITNVSMATINTSDQFIMIKFNITWDNSWRTSSAPYNWDAAWIFVKYRVNGGEWYQAKLSTTGSDYIVPAGSTIDPSNDGLGVFMYRSANGTGTNTWTNAQVRWNYGSNSVANDAANVEVRVIGIEMVYVPQGPFYAGDNETSRSGFKQGSTDSDPWYISSETEINVTNSAGSGTGIGQTNAEYYYVSGERDGEDISGSEFNIPSGFPKGYRDFYCMKYEITQGQYIEFLNMLSRAQQSARVWSNISSDAVSNIYVMSNTDVVSSRNNIVCPGSGNGTVNPIQFTTISADVACNYLSWADGIAYADWAGLRPMSELEFEKACRGPVSALSGEFAWGDATLDIYEYSFSNLNAANEGISSSFSTTTGNAAYFITLSTLSGPLRVGIFASNPGNTGRITSGAGYSGILELSGNLWERTVTVGNIVGRNFTGVNGNGELSSNGDADVPNWPDNTAVGSGFRGGVWGYNADYLRTSDRISAAYALDIRYSFFGFRGVRFQ
jgi:formylglycine-generating enzyme required for sulfatase activity